MKILSTIFFSFLFSVSLFSQRHFIYVEKYVDDKLITSSADDSALLKLSLTSRKKDTVMLRKEGPVFAYTLLKSTKAMHIRTAQMTITVSDKRVLRNKTLVIQLREKSECASAACKVYYNNGGYISILSNNKQSCYNEIYLIKPTFHLQGDKWISKYMNLFPYQTGQIK